MKHENKKGVPMKGNKFVSTVAAVLVVLGAGVQAARAEVLVARTVRSVPVEISAQTVKLSRADYAMPTLKVLIPALADVTLLDHRNRGEGAPCMGAGREGSPEDVIQNNPATEQVPVTIELVRNVTQPQDGRCEVYLSERLSAEIRGVRFGHERHVRLGSRLAGDCR